MRGMLVALGVVLAPTGASAGYFEVTAGGGYTLVDPEAVVAEDEIAGSGATDWGLGNYGLSAQYFLSAIDSVTFGGEIGYQYLYWYDVRIPFGTTPIFRGYEVDTIRFAAIARLMNRQPLSVDLGVEFNIIDGLTLGALASANVAIPLSPTTELPIKFRVDLFDYIEPTAVFSLNVGVRWGIDPDGPFLDDDL